MGSSLGRRNQERTWLIALAALAVIGLWPSLLAPLGRTYVLFCARFLTEVPFRHHFPPLLVAFAGLIVFILAVGLGVALARQLVGQWKLEANLTARVCEPDAELRQVLAKLDIEGRTVITHDIDRVYAFCSGLLRTRIFLSYGLLRLLSYDEIEAVLRHERHHLRRHDPLRLFLGSLGASLSGVMPVLATLERRLRIQIELAADRESVSAVGVDMLASALVKVGLAASAVDHRVVMAALSPTEARVAALIGGDVKAPLPWRDLAMSALFLSGLLSLSVWLALQSLPLPPECLACPPF